MGKKTNNDYHDEFVCDYQMMTNKEKSFNDVMEKQSRYDFLGHQNRTPEESKNLFLENIPKWIKKYNIKVITILMFIMMGFSMTSCEKDLNEQPNPLPQSELLKVNVQLTDIFKVEMGTKGWDETTWVYNYNPNPFDLVFTNINNPSESLTRSTTIQELQTGISVNLFSGTYNITFLSVHSSTNNVDIRINMENVVVNGSSLTLNGTYEDFLIMVDVPNVQGVFLYQKSIWKQILQFNQTGDLWYIYYNNPSSDYLTYISYTGGDSKEIFLTGYINGNVYWITKPNTTPTQITFPVWNINKIIV